MNNAPIKIDLTYLYSITGGDKVFEHLLLGGSIADIENIIADLKECWAQRDIAGIRNAAHSLIPLAAIAGMSQVESWSRTIDQSFADGVFRPELATFTDSIISGWPCAKLHLLAIIAPTSNVLPQP